LYVISHFSLLLSKFSAFEFWQLDYNLSQYVFLWTSLTSGSLGFLNLDILFFP
jgi:hypothetical protein